MRKIACLLTASSNMKPLQYGIQLLLVIFLCYRKLDCAWKVFVYLSFFMFVCLSVFFSFWDLEKFILWLAWFWGFFFVFLWVQTIIARSTAHLQRPHLSSLGIRYDSSLFYLSKLIVSKIKSNATSKRSPQVCWVWLNQLFRKPGTELSLVRDN